MSCPEITSGNGRRGIGVIQPQSGLDYPFVRFSAPSSEDNAFRYLVADFYLAYDDAGEYDASVPKSVFPLRLKYIYGLGCDDNGPPEEFFTPTHTADLLIVDANDNTVFDTTTATNFDVNIWNADYTIYTWSIDAPYQIVCRLTLYTSWTASDDDRREYSKYLVPENAILDARTIQKLPRRLLSVSVRQETGTTVNGPYVGNLIFSNYYNTTVTAAARTTSNFVSNTNVTFAGVAGSGFGYYPVCGNLYDEETQQKIPQPIRRINGVGATAAGDFAVAGKDCMFVRRPTVLDGANVRPSTTAQLQVGADCRPCCECNDYVNTALYMNNVQARYSLIGTRVKDLKLIHEQNIAKWQDKRACSLSYPLKLIFVSQGCPTLDVVAMLCNPCNDVCLPSSTLNLALETISGASAELICGYTALFAPGINGSSIPITITGAANGNINLSFKMPSVSPGSSNYVKFRLKFSPRLNYAVKGTLTGNIDDPARTQIKTGCPGETPDEERVIASAVATQDLYCSDTGETDTPC
jgi:hypothetical protein